MKDLADHQTMSFSPHLAAGRRVSGQALTVAETKRRYRQRQAGSQSAKPMKSVEHANERQYLLLRDKCNSLAESVALEKNSNVTKNKLEALI